MRRSIFPSVLLAIAVVYMAGCGGSDSSTDFMIAVSPSSANLFVGVSGQVTVSVTATGSGTLSTPITATLSGLPAGVMATPASFTLTAGKPQTVSLSALNPTGTAQTVTVTGTAGGRTHTATFSISANVPPADFTLSANPSSATLVIGGAPVNIAFTATGTGSLHSTIGLSFSNLPSGVSATPATLALISGQAQQVAFTAAATAAPGTATIMADGAYNAVRHSTPVTLTLAASQVAASPDVTTYHFDNARDGLNAQETVLTPANVASATFGRTGFFKSDGLVDAQPLYLAGLNVTGKATNVLYMATEEDSVYAFNADTGATLWHISVLGSNEEPSDDHGCYQISPHIGITSTPVIDRAKGTIYVVGMSLSKSDGKYHQRLHALSLTTGAEMSGSPVEITGSYPGNGADSTGGVVPFKPEQYAERAGLLLLNGKIYLTWTSHCDNGAYTGWVMAYDETTLQQTAILNLTPNGNDGAVWMSGNGMAADASGNIYLLNGNGTLDPGFDANGLPSLRDFGNAIVKLNTTNSTLTVADFFTPFDTQTQISNDTDLGSGGAMLLPDLTDAGGKTRHLLVGAGKDGRIYVGDRDNLGKFHAGDNSNIYQVLPNALAHGAWSSPTYFNNTVYYAGQADTLKAFPISQARLATTPSSQSVQVFAYPGSTPSISANGTQNGIVWALESNPSNPGVLHAYDPADLTHEYYNSDQAANGRDSFGNGNKFIAPVVVDGRVFVGTPMGVAEFGLMAH